MIPFVDLQTQNGALEPELVAACQRVIRNGRYTLGDEVEKFEKQFASFIGTRYAIALSSGTAALQLALVASNIGPGDEVLIPAMTFIATLAAVDYVGATPRLVDIEPQTRTLDPRRIEWHVTPRTKAIIPVHLHGGAADMGPILDVARDRNLVVIEDAAQAHGGAYHGQNLGSFGKLACFSFYPAKNLGACGEGGAVATDDPILAEQIRILRDWGQRHKYEHFIKGFNFRMDSMQAAILRIKLQYLACWNAKRAELARLYRERLPQQNIVLPAVRKDTEHVFHTYAIETRNRDALQARLTEEGIGTGIHYPIPLHMQPAYADLGYRYGDFPIAEAFAAHTLSLPLFPDMTETQLDQVATVVRDYVFESLQYA